MVSINPRFAGNIILQQTRQKEDALTTDKTKNDDKKPETKKEDDSNKFVITLAPDKDTILANNGVRITNAKLEKPNIITDNSKLKAPTAEDITSFDDLKERFANGEFNDMNPGDSIFGETIAADGTRIKWFVFCTQSTTSPSYKEFKLKYHHVN